ncbi:hypothetical protein LTR93_005133 [Exophiala xenobiotica]|nr:hypothetical protein LTR93_005133 [Exophiala xenobiotica]
MAGVSELRKKLDGTRALAAIKARLLDFDFPEPSELENKDEFFKKFNLTDETYASAKSQFEDEATHKLDPIEKTYPAPIEDSSQESSWLSLTPQTPRSSAKGKASKAGSLTPRAPMSPFAFPDDTQGNTQDSLYRRTANTEAGAGAPPSSQHALTSTLKRRQSMGEESARKKRTNIYSMPSSEEEEHFPYSDIDFDDILNEREDDISRGGLATMQDRQDVLLGSVEDKNEENVLLKQSGIMGKAEFDKEAPESEQEAFMKGCEQKLRSLMDEFGGPIKAYGETMGVLDDTPYGKKGDELDSLAVRQRTLSILQKCQQKQGDMEK